MGFVPVTGDAEALTEPRPHGGLRWVLGTGYVSMWNLLHRAEEALIEIDSREVVVAGALHDALRLQNLPRLESWDHWLASLRIATRNLDEFGATYLPEQQAAVSTRSGPDTHACGLPPQDGRDREAVAGRGGEESQHKERTARVVLAQVRRAINDYRDDCRDGLVRVRNQIMKTTPFAGIVTHILIVLAVLLGTPWQTVTGAAVYYFVGAIAGLFNRAYAESKSDKAVEDFGLTTARLIETPLLSGLAAIGGVLLLSLVGPLVQTSSGAQTASSLVEVTDVFDFTQHPANLVIA